MGIKTVSICSDPDINAPHVNMADEYINIETRGHVGCPAADTALRRSIVT